MRRLLLVLSALTVSAAACGSADAPAPSLDPRVGERGLLRFVGGGCSGSTTMAIGSRDTLTIEPAVAGDSLPGQLSARASNPDAIAASMPSASEVTLQAHAAGRSRVEILTAGDNYDALVFRAEPAHAARFAAPPRVFSGGAFDVVVTDVFGACKTEDCPLFGHGFLDWSVDPKEALEMVRDERGTATFLAGPAGNAALSGREPALRNRLVSTNVSIEPVEGITGIVVELSTIPLEEGQVAFVTELPGSVSPGTAFCLRIDALRGELPAVAVSRRDVVWTVEGDVAPVPMDHASEPFGTLFVANDAGATTLTATIDLLGIQESFALDVSP